MDAEGKEALVRLAAESMQLELTGKVVGNTAHMINNALTRVLGYVQLMEVEQDPLQRERYMEQLSLGERETVLRRASYWILPVACAPRAVLWISTISSPPRAG